ncbi:hypothetical protein ACO14J_000483 [Vibrio parahaemolyticus]|uniref:hypothetical protein n=1 Tax=Vibrio harveyi group TaxID=717610 RepID=UPI0004723BC7|nr:MULTISPECIES: hypothetical protein [Vibrio harveyi group]MCZ0758149.1 hypothetical protein [Vibrio diabolicus]TOD56064.1 hypothetical protein CGJ62_16975 [Vibrio parahaemolyticus]
MALFQLPKGDQLYFHRSGGALTASKLDLFVPTPDGSQWLCVANYYFKKADKETEIVEIDLDVGLYECRLHTYVYENLNGVFHFILETDDSVIVDVNGDINVTSSPDDDGLDVKAFQLEVV